MGNSNKILKIFTQAKVDNQYIDYNMELIDVIRKAENDGNIHRFNKDVFFCAYRSITKDNKQAVIMVFTMKLPGPISGSTSSSKMVMDIIDILEHIFLPIHDMYFLRDIDGSKKNIGALKIVKKVNEDTDIV